MAMRIVKILKRQLLPYGFSSSLFSSSAKTVPKSSLFISGERAQDTFVSVIPYLDFDERFKDLQQLEENIKRRRLDINVVELKEAWAFYKEWNGKKAQMMEKLNETNKQISALKKMEDDEKKTAELQRINIYQNLLKEDLLNVKKNVWSMEDSVIGELLKLPNTLHLETPEEESDMYVYDKENMTHHSDHIVAGETLNCFEYRNKLTYYLKNKAALFELAVPELFIEEFSKEGFIQFSNPDFTRSVLAEGVGVTADSFSDLFLLEQSENNNDRLYLCGGASLFPFCGFHAKHSVLRQFLPVKYIATGRRYNPTPHSLPGLFSVHQSTSVELFVATASDLEMHDQFEACVKKLTDVYSALGLNFKMVKQPACNLKNWESLRMSIQVFSPFHKTFVEVGNISLTDEYISKRLRMYYVDKREERFLKVVSGSLVNVQTLLALCLERSDSDLFIPDSINKYMMG